MEGVRVRHLVGLPLHARFESRFDAGRQRISRHAPQHAGDRCERDRAVGAGDAHRAIGELEIRLRGFQLLRRDL